MQAVPWSGDMGKAWEQKAGIPGWLKGCRASANICFGQHLLARRAAWKLEILHLGTSGAVLTLLKSNLIGDTSVEAPAAPISQLPYKNGTPMF